MIVKVRTQDEFDAALKAGHVADLISGIFSLVTSGSDAPEIIVRAGVELSVEARGSSRPRVEAWGSSQPRVEAWESSQPRVVARDSSQPLVVARGLREVDADGERIGP